MTRDVYVMVKRQVYMYLSLVLTQCCTYIITIITQTITHLKLTQQQCQVHPNTQRLPLSDSRNDASEISYRLRVQKGSGQV